MIVDTVLAKIFGTKTEREIKKMQPTVAAINDLEAGHARAVGYRPGRQNHRIQGEASRKARRSTTC